jgi:hypothetical protein
MARFYVFADEAGNFDFSRRQGATSWFVLGSVTLDDPTIGDRLHALRRDLAWQGVGLGSTFHASVDLQIIRDEVFRILGGESFRTDFTIVEKRKTMPHLQSEERFYKQTWYLHFKYVAKGVAKKADDLLVVAASIGLKKASGGNAERAGGRSGAVGMVVQELPGRVLARRKRPVPPDRRLRHLGRPAQIRAGGRSVL